MNFNDYKINFSAYSALFNEVDNSIFIRHNLANQVKWINNDENGINLDINNEERLKITLFNEIQIRYNNRINSHKLNLPRLSKNDLKNLEILKFLLIFQRKDGSSGYYNVYPRSFYCNKCGDYRVFTTNEEFEKFNPKKCRKKGCDGKYEQLSFVGFCDKCGIIKPFYHHCKTHGRNFLKLDRPDKEYLSSWSILCTECGEKWDFVPICNHYNYSNKISNETANKFTPLNIMEGSIYQSVVITVVDIPKNTNFGANMDYIMIGLYLKRFDSIFNTPAEVTFDKLKNFLDMYNNSKNMDNMEQLINSGLFNKKFFDLGENIYKEITLIKEEFEGFPINEINDYLILKDYFGSSELNTISYDKYIKNDEKFISLQKDYDSLKESLGIEDINYISDVHLISSSIGTIKGLNKFYESEYVPHFEPHWKSKDNEVFKVYSYPFETEGIMIDLDKIKIVDWLIDNEKLYSGNKIRKNHVESEEEAKKILFDLEYSTEKTGAYSEVKKLLHTFSHILITRSSVYTGLDPNSCSELLFPKTGAFMIYSTSNINIGGFLFIFENSLFDWFKDVKLDINDCVFDPTCMQENGACFSCLYLPEFVCSEFNNLLDRDVFLGKERYKKGYWNYI